MRPLGIMTKLAAAGNLSDSATVCGGALSNRPKGENGAVQQPCVAHEAVAARAVVMAPDKMLPSVARASSVVVTRRRFVRIVFLQAEGGCKRLSNPRDFGAFQAVSYRGEANLGPGESHK